jgi:hypothetical protein
MVWSDRIYYATGQTEQSVDDAGRRMRKRFNLLKRVIPQSNAGGIGNMTEDDVVEQLIAYASRGRYQLMWVLMARYAQVNNGDFQECREVRKAAQEVLEALCWDKADLSLLSAEKTKCGWVSSNFFDVYSRRYSASVNPDCPPLQLLYKLNTRSAAAAAATPPRQLLPGLFSLESGTYGDTERLRGCGQWSIVIQLAKHHGMLSSLHRQYGIVAPICFPIEDLTGKCQSAVFYLPELTFTSGAGAAGHVVQAGQLPSPSHRPTYHVTMTFSCHCLLTALSMCLLISGDRFPNFQTSSPVLAAPNVGMSGQALQQPRFDGAFLSFGSVDLPGLPMDEINFLTHPDVVTDGRDVVVNLMLTYSEAETVLVRVNTTSSMTSVREALQWVRRRWRLNAEDRQGGLKAFGTARLEAVMRAGVDEAMRLAYAVGQMQFTVTEPREQDNMQVEMADNTETVTAAAATTADASLQRGRRGKKTGRGAASSDPDDDSEETTSIGDDVPDKPDDHQDRTVAAKPRLRSSGTSPAAGRVATKPVIDKRPQQKMRGGKRGKLDKAVVASKKIIEEERDGGVGVEGKARRKESRKSNSKRGGKRGGVGDGAKRKASRSPSPTVTRKRVTSRTAVLDRHTPRDSESEAVECKSCSPASDSYPSADDTSKSCVKLEKVRPDFD